MNVNKDDRQTIVKGIKIVARVIVGSGTSGIVKSAIEANTAAPETKYRKLTHWAGSLALGALVADQTKDHVGAKIDSYAEMFEKAKAQIDGQETTDKKVGAAAGTVVGSKVADETK